MADHKEREKYYRILKYNNGFANPTRWINYAIKKNFTKVRAIRLSQCPDCKKDDLEEYGQFVYYSTLIKLRCCKFCGLIFCDQIIDDHIIKKHFDRAYKNNKYFETDRREIYSQIAKIVSKLAPYEAEVIDVGGAKGHLMDIVRKQRPDDLLITVNDISPKALDYAKEIFGFNTICCSLGELINLDDKFDLVLLLDVLYYEKAINIAWKAIWQLLKDGGCVIIRIPNKLWLIKLHLFVEKLIKTKKNLEMKDSIKFFNPEHLYIFSRKYIHTKLRKLGMSRLKFFASKALVRECKSGIINKAIFHICNFIYYITFRTIILTPSQIVIVQKSIGLPKNDSNDSL